MINEQLKSFHFKQNILAGAKKRERQERRKRSIEHYEEIINGRKENNKVWKLERTEEGDTRICKVRL